MTRSARSLLLLCTLWGVSSCTFDMPPELVEGARDLGRDDRGVRDAARDQLIKDFPTRRDLGVLDLPALEDADGQDLARDLPGDLARDLARDEGAPDEGRDSGPGFAICDGARVDLTTNPSHCGACEQACDEVDGVCAGGVCACLLSGAEPCGDSGECVDALYDPRHCGGCGVVCEVGQVCDAGSCRCRDGLTRCGSECVDSEIDPLHCGACDNDCGEGNRCKQGSCDDRRSCGPGYTSCRRDDRAACLSDDDDDEENDLYCRPGAPFGGDFDLFCGERCEGDELCVDSPDFLVSTQCRVYRPARQCDACPCDACEDDEMCRRQILGVDDLTYCVKAR